MLSSRPREGEDHRKEIQQASWLENQSISSRWPLGQNGSSSHTHYPIQPESKAAQSWRRAAGGDSGHNRQLASCRYARAQSGLRFARGRCSVQMLSVIRLSPGAAFFLNAACWWRGGHGVAAPAWPLWDHRCPSTDPASSRPPTLTPMSELGIRMPRVLSSLNYPLSTRVVGAPQMISQPVSSIFPSSPLPAGTWRIPGPSIP